MRKKQLAFLSVSVLMLMVPFSAAAVSDVVSKSTASAVLNTLSSMTVTLENVANTYTASQLAWTAPTNTWVESDQCFKIAYNSNDIGWGIQIYTDNHNAGASPAYTGPTAAGYEGQGLIGVTNSMIYAPLAWTALTAKGARPPITTNPVDGTLNSNNAYAYFKDRLQSSFVDGNDYITIVNGNGLARNDGLGRVYGVTSPVYVYVIANFKGVGNQTYRTNQLTVELYHQ
ncbi:MAG: hypothetical protein HGA76_09655 [Candidatus Firestonebacteria bacterium]|nr:hypothetical protein [Candidatus Firestonebacteria bacterium]